MKKTKVVLILFLGLLLGRVSAQFTHIYATAHEPKLAAKNMTLSGIIQSIGQVVAPRSSVTARYRRFDEIYQLLQDKYYDTTKLNSGVMLERAVKAFVDGIDDPYTVYMDSVQNSGFHEELKGATDFEGIGAVVSKKDYYVQIEEVLKGSPAFKAGLMPLDRVLMVNSGSVKDLDVNAAVAKIRGPKGSNVTLTIERLNKTGDKQVLQKSVMRDKVSVPSVTTQLFTGTNKTSIAYINISIIGEETEHLLKASIKELKKNKLKGVIVDLRGNGGGLLPIAAQIVSHFVPKNKVVVITKYKVYEDEKYLSEGYMDLAGLPVVVLVDGMTASAGEIIALALQEQIGAKIVGTQTFGKGSIQTMEEFTDGDSLKYTIGKWYAPSGKTIDKVGIAPDVIVEFSADSYTKDKIDTQLEKAKSLLK